MLGGKKQWHFSFPLPLQHGPGIQSSLNPHGWDETKPGRQKECSKNQRCQPLTLEDAVFFRFKIILLDTWPPLRETSAVVYDAKLTLHSLTLLCEVQGGCLGEPGLAQGWAHGRWRWPTQRMRGGMHWGPEEGTGFCNVSSASNRKTWVSVLC